MLKEMLPRRGHGLMMKRHENIFDMMDDLWRRPFAMLPNMAREESFPAMDICEDGDQVTVTAELPGIKPEDIDVEISGDRLIIKGEKKFEDEEKKDDYHRIERSYGSFIRSVILPGNADEEGVKAVCKDGVLTLTIPKVEREKSRKVQIES